jgi:ribA/ribD-fused uncharacterized protein
MQLNINENTQWSRAGNVIVCKAEDTWGGLSNMSGKYPLSVNGINIFSSEALYQACRFPLYPDVQALILEQKSPMTAKMKGKPHRKTHNRPDWLEVSLDVMRWCLRVKAAQHKVFREMLIRTGERQIVEDSHNRNERFWGAVGEDQNGKTDRNGDILRGANVLGSLLMEVRVELQNSTTPSNVLPMDIPYFLLYGKQIDTVEFIC